MISFFMEYQVIARKYRPKTFGEILGQGPLVKTLKNALQSGRLAHAYLFSGPRGTGKTTTARIFAKALNCTRKTVDLEPCNACASCQEIASGHSLDVLEIDGASHRGVEHIRQINETAAYAPSTGEYKIYLIDEVHMLTKEAFNALLKTLEEPPKKVKFFFATTEPHKVLPTILSRCQRFHLNRIPDDLIVQKLEAIVKDLDRKAEEGALRRLARCSEGALRDAESLLDQALSFQEGPLTEEAVSDLLGIVPQQAFFDLDQAAEIGSIRFAFELSQAIFTQGKDLGHFLEDLIEHFRTLLILKLCGPGSSSLFLAEGLLKEYLKSEKLYSKEECLALLDYLLEAQKNMRHSPSPRIFLENLLTKVLRIHHRIPLEALVKRLQTLEQRITLGSEEPAAQPQGRLSEDPEPKLDEIPKAPPVSEEPRRPAEELAAQPQSRLSEDPEPKLDEILKTVQKAGKPDKKQQSRYDTLLQFAAVELEGTLKKV